MMKVSQILPKAVYFLLFLAGGVSWPYYSVLLSGLMPETWIGWTMGALQSCGFIFAPMWGMIADASKGRHAAIMAILCLVGMGMRFGGLFFLGDDRSPWIAALTMVLSEALFSGVVPICDSLVCSSLKGDEEFGHQRLFGALSWGIAAPLSGFVYTIIPMRWGLVLTWVLSVPFVVCVFLLAPNNQQSKKTTAPKLGFLASLKSARLKWQQWCFLGCALFSGFCNSSIGTFLFLHLRSMGGNSTMMGLSVLMMILSEIPFMYFSNRIARAIGTFTCVQGALIAYTLRLFGYQALGTWASPWFVLAIEPLHGITFGIFYSVCVSYIAQGIANDETKSTWQGVFGGMIAIGRAAGSVGGGYLYAAGGGTLLFRVGCIILAGATVAFFFVVLTDRGFVPIEPDLALKEERLELELVEIFSADEEEDDDDAIVDEFQ